MIYFDNAATSWPKPPGVAEAMVAFSGRGRRQPGPLRAPAVGRGGAHRLSTPARRWPSCSTRPIRCASSLAHNVTEALNLALRGLLRPGDHVITSSMEHNSVMRPLRALERARASS